MELVVALLAWIGGQTGLATPPPPSVLFVNEEQMLRLAGGRVDVKGLYDSEAVTVYLRDDWDAADLRGRATLLHELVHHVQHFNDLPMQCRAERELLAYNLTLEWLREQGAPDPHAVLDIDDFTILVRAMCPEG
jgi:hypothetical protein